VQYCQSFPDVCPKALTGSESEAEKKKTEDDNKRKRAMYLAIRHILVNDFGFKGLPATVDFFPGNLHKEQIAQYLAVHGLLLADNYTDPMLGKNRASPDDVVVTPSLFIAHRFLDAVVKAVQEYTAQRKLFQNVYDLMNEEGAQPAKATAGGHPSTIAKNA